MRPNVSICDRQDPRLALYLDLKDRDLRLETGCFLAEGEHVVRRAFAASLPGAGLRVRSVLVVENKADRVEAMVAASSLDGVEVLVCTKEVMAQTVGMKLHQGIIAAVEPPPRLGLDQLMEAAGINPTAREHVTSRADGLTPTATKHPTVVVCPEITNVENLGLLVRVCAGLGVDAMVLGPRCCDPWYRRAVRVSMGAVFTMPMARSDDLDADLDRLRDGFGFELIATVTDRDAEPLHATPRAPGGRFRGRGWGRAILLGSEGYGLPPDIVQRCDRRVRIPMHRDVDSLNVAVAAGIVIHHFVGDVAGRGGADAAE